MGQSKPSSAGRDRRAGAGFGGGDRESARTPRACVLDSFLSSKEPFPCGTSQASASPIYGGDVGTDLDPKGVPRPSSRLAAPVFLRDDTYLPRLEVLRDPQAPRGNCRGRCLAGQRAPRKPQHKPPPPEGFERGFPLVPHPQSHWILPFPDRSRSPHEADEG